MDPQTLPPDVRLVYDRIKARYQVRFEALSVRKHRLHVLRMTDLEQILDGKNPLKDVGSFPFWVKIWEASLVLADLLVALPRLRGTTMLELGAGLGVPGLAAAAAGATVTLSDYEEHILDFERVNAAASGLKDVSFSLLDWKNPPTDMPRYDVLAGAEILFRDEFFEPLLQIMQRALKPGGVIYLAHDSRRQSLHPFLKLAEQDYVIAASKRRLKSVEEDRTIILTRLQPRK
ncbi:MAG: methyltransferase domain-containing protein [Desulfobulbaceae bacterium]|nr:methyltransferase domain-containing protein [Desulfobulbaceae bacterium]